MAVLDVPEDGEDVKISDIQYATTRCSGGHGGQNINKVETAVIATHVPTGIKVRCESGRSQHHNKQTATDLLRAKVMEQQEKQASHDRNQIRKEQVGSGQRGDKIRTVRWQDGIVTCELTKRKKSLKDYLDGRIDF